MTIREPGPIKKPAVVFQTWWGFLLFCFIIGAVYQFTAHWLLGWC